MDEEEVEFGGHNGGHGTGWGGWNDRWRDSDRWRRSRPVYVPVPVAVPVRPQPLVWQWDPYRRVWFVAGYAVAYSPDRRAWVSL